MIKYKLTLYSKNKYSLNAFLKFLKYNTKLQNLKLLLKLSKRKTIRNKFSILKSPHVNKKAQEHFEFRIYRVDMVFCSWNIKKYLFIIKKIKDKLFPDIKIKLKGNFYNNITYSNINKTYSPDNFKFYDNAKLNNNIRNKKLLNNTITYFKILELYKTFQ